MTTACRAACTAPRAVVPSAASGPPGQDCITATESAAGMGR